jgi:hypothetical protein
MGAVSGAFAAAATTPLDVIKTRMMCSAAARPTMSSSAIAVWSSVRLTPHACICSGSLCLM